MTKRYLPEEFIQMCPSLVGDDFVVAFRDFEYFRPCETREFCPRSSQRRGLQGLLAAQAAAADCSGFVVLFVSCKIAVRILRRQFNFVQFKAAKAVQVLLVRQRKDLT